MRSSRPVRALKAATVLPPAIGAIMFASRAPQEPANAIKEQVSPPPAATATTDGPRYGGPGSLIRRSTRPRTPAHPPAPPRGRPATRTRTVTAGHPLITYIRASRVSAQGYGGYGTGGAGGPGGYGYGCGAAVAWLRAYAAPGFSIECPGYADGHQAMTCNHIAGMCPDSRVIVIADPCPAAYMNEANNSWILTHLRRGPLDPYGSCPAG